MTGGGGEGRPAPRALSVLMVAWGRQDLLDASLGAVRRFLPGAQAVVVDNGSEPPLRLPAGVEAVRAPRNLGFAGGNNLGLARCTGDYVLLLNTDAVLPSAEPAETLLAFLEAHPGVAVAQAKLRLPDGTLDACGEGLTPLGLLYHHGYRRPDGPHAARPRPVFAAKAACALVRRAAIADAGGAVPSPLFPLLRGHRFLPPPVVGRVGVLVRAHRARGARGGRHLADAARAAGLAALPLEHAVLGL